MPFHSRRRVTSLSMVRIGNSRVPGKWATTLCSLGVSRNPLITRFRPQDPLERQPRPLSYINASISIHCIIDDLSLVLSSLEARAEIAILAGIIRCSMEKFLISLHLLPRFWPDQSHAQACTSSRQHTGLLNIHWIADHVLYRFSIADSNVRLKWTHLGFTSNTGSLFHIETFWEPFHVNHIVLYKLRWSSDPHNSIHPSIRYFQEWIDNTAENEWCGRMRHVRASGSAPNERASQYGHRIYVIGFPIASFDFLWFRCGENWW